MNDLAGARVVITGGAGFIGSHLVECVLAAGAAEVTVVDDLSTGTTENLERVADDVGLIVGDVCEPEYAEAACDADIVFHLAVRNVRASIRRPVENLRVNAEGTLALLEAVRAAGGRGRFVYVSSSEVYGTPADGTFSEDTLPAPTTVYGAGKLAGEHLTLAYHRTYGIDARVVRPFNAFGPRSHFEGDCGEVIPKFILRALAGRPLIIHGDGSQTRDFTFVRDTAAWLLRLALNNALEGQVVNIGAGRETSVAELARRILRLTGSVSDIVHDEPRPGDLPRLRAHTAKVEALAPLGTRIGLDAGLAETISYFAERDAETLLEREVVHTWT
jgi:UDP-glucose 4-epimerase